ncbi:unnamed protein product, partial [Medioppia subpectinata]
MRRFPEVSIVYPKLIKCDFPDCKQTFKQTNHIVKQRNRVHLKLRFICDFKDCNKGFHKMSYLKEHKSTHLTVKPFKCHYKDCGGSYARNQYLQKHVKYSHKN